MSELQLTNLNDGSIIMSGSVCVCVCVSVAYIDFQSDGNTYIAVYTGTLMTCQPFVVCFDI